ncbi:Mur ligase domain-containing protein, partial [Streptomyces sp. NPDC048629]|uniref:Mur ligase domain-containing protein n=1 Tax=Streptomyces sp. NPDC048629 TaxID=3154824 RepID=UPI003446540F
MPQADQYRTTPPRPAQPSPTPLGELAARLGVETAGQAEVTGITHDSRAVRPGDVYAALPGARLHGADFAAQAAGLGAVAILMILAGIDAPAAERRLAGSRGHLRGALTAG